MYFEHQNKNFLFYIGTLSRRMSFSSRLVFFSFLFLTEARCSRLNSFLNQIIQIELLFFYHFFALEILYIRQLLFQILITQGKRKSRDYERFVPDMIIYPLKFTKIEDYVSLLHHLIFSLSVDQHKI